MKANYWKNNAKTAKVSTDSISIPATNGLNFSSNANTNIRLNIPNTIPFFIGDQSYIRFRLDLSMTGTSNLAGAGTSNSFVQMIPELGAAGIIRNLTIRTGGQILEQIQNYNSLALLKNQYDSTQDKDNVRSITEGCVLYDPRCRSTDSNLDYIEKSLESNCATNPYFETTTGDDGLRRTKQTSCDVCLPLHLSGIMGSNKIVPSGMLNLEIEIELETASRIMRGNRNAIQSSGTNGDIYNPQLNFGRTSTGTVGEDGDGLEEDLVYNRIYVSDRNNLVDTDYQPFMIGEVININTNGGTQTLGKISGIGRAFDNTGVGQKYIFYDLAANYTANDDSDTYNTIHSNNFTSTGLTGLKLKYDVSNVELILKRAEVEPEYVKQMAQAMKENGKIRYEFPSYTCYTRQVLATELNSTINLPLQNSMARSLLCIPTQTQVNDYNNLTNFQTFTQHYFNLAGQNTTNFYQFMYQGRLHPNRVVNCLDTALLQSFNQVHLLELEKSLTQSNIPPNNLRCVKHNFTIGRSLSVGNGYYDTRGKDFQLNLDLTSITQLNKLYNIFCSHIRRLEMSSEGIKIII